MRQNEEMSLEGIETFCGTGITRKYEGQNEEMSLEGIETNSLIVRPLVTEPSE